MVILVVARHLIRKSSLSLAVMDTGTSGSRVSTSTSFSQDFFQPVEKKKKKKKKKKQEFYLSDKSWITSALHAM